MNDQPPEHPLVILGIDAGDPHLLRKWAREGHLPTLASIMERGSWAQTGGPELTIEHGTWHSLLSGVSRGSHGCYYFHQLRPGTYDLELAYGAELDAPPFWTWLRGKRKRAVVIDMPDILPVPGVAGEQIANWALHHGWSPSAPPEMPCSEPADLLGEVNRTIGPAPVILEAPGASGEHNRRLRRELLARVEKKGALCRLMLDRGPADLIALCFCESHTAGHQFWRHRSEALGDQAGREEEFAYAMRDVYQAIDREMGLLLGRLPPSANVFVLSSVGLTDHYPTGGLTEAFCRQLGYMVPAEPGPVSFRPMALARRVLPEHWRLALSRYLPRATRERLLADQFRTSTNWKKTTAFCIPSFYTSYLRVNLRGREPEGIVEPGAAYEAILRRLETDFLQLIDPKTGEPAIDKIVRSVDVFGCDPPQTLPDLIVHWKPCAHFLERVVHPRAELAQETPEFFRDSDHIAHGFVAAAGPQIAALGEIAEVEALDLAPTFLALLNECKPEQMTGKVVEAFLAAQLVQSAS